jgi:hypothetical protein
VAILDHIAVIVDVGDDGVLEAGAAVVVGELELDGAVGAGEDVEVDLVGVDDVGHAVALEVVDRAAGDPGGGVLGGLGPQDRAVGVEHAVAGFAGDADLGEAVAVVVGDGRRAAEAAGERDVSTGRRRCRCLEADGAVRDDDDLGDAVEVEVGDGGVAVGGGR